MLPAFYSTGDTMAALRHAIGQTLRLGHAHHVQRLMVTDLCALLLGGAPRALRAWYLAVDVDAVEWVEPPNALGLSQQADGGTMGSKHYGASGKYIQWSCNACTRCRYDPARATRRRCAGERAAGALTMRGVAKTNLPQRDCAHRGGPFTWRKRWARCRVSVKYCSDARRRGKVPLPQERRGGR